MKNWNQPVNWSLQECMNTNAAAGSRTPTLSAGSSAPAAEECFIPGSIIGNIARVKHAHGCTEESSGSSQEQTLYVPAAEKPSLPAARMPSSAAMPAGKRPTGKARSEKCQFGIFHLNVTVGNNLLLQIVKVPDLGAFHKCNANTNQRCYGYGRWTRCPLTVNATKKN